MTHGHILILGTGLVGALIGWFLGGGSAWGLIKGLVAGLILAVFGASCVIQVRTMRAESARVEREEAQERVDTARMIAESEIDNEEYENLVKWKGVDCTIDAMVADGLKDDRITPSELETINEAEVQYNRRAQKSHLKDEKIEYCPGGKAA